MSDGKMAFDVGRCDQSLDRITARWSWPGLLPEILFLLHDRSAGEAGDGPIPGSLARNRYPARPPDGGL